MNGLKDNEHLKILNLHGNMICFLNFVSGNKISAVNPIITMLETNKKLEHLDWTYQIISLHILIWND